MLMLSIPPLAASSLGTQLSHVASYTSQKKAFAVFFSITPPKVTQRKSTSIQYSHKPSLMTEQEKLIGSQMTVIFLLRYIGSWFDSYRDTCFSHSFYSQSVLHPINTDLCKIQLNETADIFRFVRLDCNIF